jgi:hypothetical protein
MAAHGHDHPAAVCPGGVHVFTSQLGGFAASASKQQMRAAVGRFVSVLPERTSAATGVRSTRETASLVFAKPPTDSTRHISTIARSWRRTDALTEAFGVARRSNPHRAQQCCGTNSPWSNAAMPAWQAGHLSRSPQPCTKHDTRDASLHCRRKCGASSAAKRWGQYCIQVERFRCALSRNGRRSGAIAQPLIVIVEIIEEPVIVVASMAIATRRVAGGGVNFLTGG